MKNKILYAIAALVLFGTLCGKSYAAPGEVALPDGSFTNSEIAVAQISTGNAAGFETRRIRTGADGRQLVWQGVLFSSFSNITSSTQTCVVNGYIGDSTTTACPTVNRNVYDVASTSEPIYLSKIILGNLTQERVRVFDTRGSTDPGSSRQIFDKVISSTDGSGVVPDFNVFLTSGLAVFKGGTGGVTTIWSPTKRQ